VADRYFVDTPITTSRVALAGAEARHLAGVMRAKVGDVVTLFDGHGADFSARVAAIAKDRVECEIVSRHDEDRELAIRMVFGVALPKGDRQRWLVEKLVELGAAELVPIVTKRGVVQPDEGTVSRLERYVLEASKQCGRNRLMKISAPLDLAELISHSEQMPYKLVAHPSGEPLEYKSSTLEGPILAAIGPEGGFTDEEIQTFRQADWQVISLGARILRVETAACYLASVLGSR
jgi:16S rRNA (uracil1498-N3)-methyltransferase